jgi:molybdate transport system substrate-binding protein
MVSKNYFYAALAVAVVGLLGFVAVSVGDLQEASSDTRTVLTVAVASNFQRPFAELATHFSELQPIDLQPIFGASGKLTTQIRQQAPFDMFFSANAEFPEQLYREGVTPHPPITYAVGQLVLWSAEPREALSPQILTEPGIRRIAIADPQLAPYGAAAQTALVNAGIYQAIEPKLVFGRSVGQVNQYIARQAVDAAISAASVVAELALSPQHYALIPENLHQPIEQKAVMLTRAPHKLSAAKQFLAFLQTPAAQSILTKYGYRTP